MSPVLQRVIASHPGPDLEAAAIDSLASFDEPAAGKAILDHWRGYSPNGRKHAVDAMIAQNNRVPLLLKAIEEKAPAAAPEVTAAAPEVAAAAPEATAAAPEVAAAPADPAPTA